MKMISQILLLSQGVTKSHQLNALVLGEAYDQRTEIGG